MNGVIQQAGLSLATGIMNNALASWREGIAARRNYEYNERAAENADQRTRKLYLDFQSPEALLKQYKEAGLSPSLMFSGGGVGGQTTQGAQGTGTSGISPTIYGIDAVQKAQIDLLEKQAEKTQAETETIQGKNELGRSQINKIVAETNNEKLKAANQELQNGLLEIEKYVAELTKNNKVDISNAEIWKVQKSYELMVEQLREETIKNDISEETKDNVIKEINGQLTEQAARIIELRTRAQLNSAGVKLTNKQYDKLVNDILVDNAHVTIEQEHVKIDKDKLAAQIDQWAVENGLTRRGQNIQIGKIIVDALMKHNDSKGESFSAILGMLKVLLIK